MVAKGIQITNRSVIHGHEFNVDTHATFQITEVADTNYIPEHDNPFEEPLNVGQYALWKLEDVIPEESNTPHGIIRTSARDKYLKTAQKQQEIYDKQCANMEINYKENEIRVIPCEINKPKSSIFQNRFIICM